MFYRAAVKDYFVLYNDSRARQNDAGGGVDFAAKSNSYRKRSVVAESFSDLRQPYWASMLSRTALASKAFEPAGGVPLNILICTLPLGLLTAETLEPV